MSLVTCVDVYGKSVQVDSSELSWRPAVYGIVIEGTKILLTKQRACYALPGGGVDLGETLEAALVREINEETGLNVTVQSMVGGESILFKHPAGGDHPYVQSISLFYTATYDSGVISTAGFNEYEREVAEQAEWFELDRIPHLDINTTFDWRKYVAKVVVK